MTAPLHAFLSAAPADRPWAGALCRGLQGRGLAAALAPARSQAPDSWRGELRGALRAAPAVVALVGDGSEPSPDQRWERQAVLEAVWSDAVKRLIPVLLRDAALPAYLRSVFPADAPIPVYRVKVPRHDLARAARDLAAVLRGEADLAAVGELVDTADEDRSLRRQRLSWIRCVAESLPG